MFQVFSRHTGDKLAEQPRGPDPPEDGRGRHLRPGGQGQDAARAFCISVAAEKNSRPPVAATCTSVVAVCQLRGLT